MKSRTRVVVIGGGIAGCSTLYHLTEEGWSDVVLIERDELTSGTTWHSAAQVTNFGMKQAMVGLKSHSIALYKELSEDPDYPGRFVRCLNEEIQVRTPQEAAYHLMNRIYTPFDALDQEATTTR